MTLDPALFSLAPERTALLIIDIQDRLLAAMAPADQDRVVSTTRTLIAGAHAAGASILVTEQYPKGLGPTVAPLRDALGEAGVPADAALDKVEFDCSAAPGFAERLGAGTDAVVIAGMEAHVCVLQTVAGLLRTRPQSKLWVVEDAIASRNDAHRHSAIATMRQLGAVVAPAEAALFALVGKAGSPTFKAISKLVK